MKYSEHKGAQVIFWNPVYNLFTFFLKQLKDCRQINTIHIDLLLAWLLKA